MNFRENYLEGDPTCLYNAAQALRTIQQLYGIVPHVYGKGQAAKQVRYFFIPFELLSCNVIYCTY